MGEAGISLEYLTFADFQGLLFTDTKADDIYLHVYNNQFSSSHNISEKRSRPNYLSCKHVYSFNAQYTTQVF